MNRFVYFFRMLLIEIAPSIQLYFWQRCQKKTHVANTNYNLVRIFHYFTFSLIISQCCLQQVQLADRNGNILKSPLFTVCTEQMAFSYSNANLHIIFGIVFALKHIHISTRKSSFTVEYFVEFYDSKKSKFFTVKNRFQDFFSLFIFQKYLCFTSKAATPH